MNPFDTHHHTSPSFPITKGSQVEVLSVNGAWYVATVIHPPPPSPIPHNHDSLVYVEYTNLLPGDDSFSRLREYANISSLRPSPPPDANPPNFRLNDRVDAFYRDAWWTGEITSVIDASNFIVTVQNLPYQIQFRDSDLRLHREWQAGRWLQSQKQETAGLLFTVGRKVEVSFDRESLRDCWLPATLLQNTGNNTFLVEYQQPGAGDEVVLHEATVDHLHIRPSPPHLREKRFAVFEKVDAFYDFGWWSGVITKNSDDNRYTVFIKRTKKETEFDQSKVRAHLEWKGGKWFNTSQGEMEGRAMLEQTSPSMSKLVVKRAMQKCQDSNDKGSPPSKKPKVQAEPMKDDLSKKTSVPSVSQSEGEKLQNPSTEPTENVAGRDTQQPSVPSPPLTVTEKGGEAASVAQKRKRGRPPKSRVSGPKTPITSDTPKDVPSALPTVEVAQKKAGMTKGLVTELVEEFQVSDFIKEQAGIQTSPLSNGAPSNENTRQELGVQPSQGTKKYVAGRRGKRRTISLNPESSAQDSQDGSNDKNLEKDSSKRTAEASVGKSTDTVSDDLPVSSQLEGKSSVAVSCPDGTVEPSLVASDRQLETGGVNSENLPFVKNMSLWKTLESTDAFRLLPQRPHFRPLESAKKFVREGLAIGTMVTFLTVVDKTCGMKTDEPRATVEECLASLVELETHGFDVEAIRKRLTRLLQVKDKQEEVAGQTEVFLGKMEEHRAQMQTNDQELDKIDGLMRELAENKKLMQSKKEKSQSELAAVEARVRENEQLLRGLATEFEELVAAPF